jgi:hypothetical protein
MMTPRPNPDDQLLDFIEGRDALSQQLKALKNHPDQQAPAALDATILAQIERSLVEESNANKQVHASKLNPKKTPSFNLSLDFLFKHWAIPAGITALLVLGVTLQLRDTAQEKNPVQLAESKVQQVDERVFIPAQISAEQDAPPVEMHSPVTPQVIASEPETTMQVARKKAKSIDMLVAAKQTPAPAPTIMAEAETYAKPQTQVASADELISAKIAPAPVPAPVPVPVPVPSIATATPTPSLKILGSSGSLNRAREQNQAQAQTTIQIPASTVAQITEQEIKTVLSPATATRFAEAPLGKSAELPMSAAAPKPAVSAVSAISTISTISAKPIIEEEASWLKRIEEQLKQEKNETALKEWQAFRKAYPHANISESTLKKLQALEQAKKEP